MADFGCELAQSVAGTHPSGQLTCGAAPVSVEHVTVTATTSVRPLAPGHPGRWSDGDVTVCHERSSGLAALLVADREPDAVTAHFTAHRSAAGLTVQHRTTPDELDDDLTGLIAGELGPVLRGPDDFRRVFTGVVRSTVSDPVTAWAVFYANTLAALDGASGIAGGSIAGFAPVQRRALSLVRGDSVLDLGSCFGFLALRMADQGRRVVATDLCQGTVGLLRAVADRLGRQLSTLVCDARRVPVASGSVDTVTAVHLLEHLPTEDSALVLGEALRVARRRVVVGVPFETEPTREYGHVRTFDLATLDALGAATGHPYEVSEYHGGWLVLGAAP